MKPATALFILISAPLLFYACNLQTGNYHSSEVNGHIHPDPEKGFWVYKGDMVMLLGGSSEDNLFQVQGVEEELDLLKAAGGNYVRCTMSSRDPGNAWPFLKNDDGLYDLGMLNPDYWENLDHFFAAASERDIIVQLEVWATFDFYRNNWDVNPFNPANNINYNAKRSKLPIKVPSHPIFTENNFFRSVPSQMAIAPVLDAQQIFVDQLLSISLKYGNILYCMDNETSVTSDWGKFWASYIREKAGERGLFVNTTEMWDPWELDHPFHAETFNNPGIFNFVDISQNNHQTGDIHWENGLETIERIGKMGIRPVNNVKVYGNDGGRHKTTREGTENFIQNVLMGCASARFHRPESGQGLNEIAQSVIRSMRMFTDVFDHFNGIADNSLLVDRTPGEHYCRYIEGKQYAVYFTRQGKVKLDLASHRGNLSLRWLNILESEWVGESSVNGGETVDLSPPAEGHWIALLSSGS
ncbi:MAG: hypothetical protein K9J30_14045 [Bacteroidales bacterium]|nr:hypothetical protein [Bacteroidales bacterium]